MNNVHPHYPDVLITGDALQAKLGDGAVIVEVDIDPEAYGHGHIPGALHWDWKTQLRDPSTEEILSREAFGELMDASGISNDTEVILYGDNNNWFACWAFWLMRMYGHGNVRILDGGTRLWMAEGRPVSLEAANPQPSAKPYVTADTEYEDQATVFQVFESFFQPQTHRLLDVRSEAEFEGELLGPGVGAASTCAVAGHIPTAINVPWILNCNPDGTFKSRDELLAVYASYGIRPELTVITYCAIGERASLSWFVLKHLLKFPWVRNFDKSMSHWSRLPNAPVVNTGRVA